MKKKERQIELIRKREEAKMERYSRFQGVNLYIKNLEDEFDDERLRKEFSKFGNITSAKVWFSEGVLCDSVSVLCDGVGMCYVMV